MDLVSEVNRLRLDLLSVQASEALNAAGVPHALLKGPSTAAWLYEPPRHYFDVDLLVPLSRVAEAAAVLEHAGVAQPSGGRVGEEAEHSYLMTSPDGYEVDLHISLPTLHPDGDRIWDALAPHIESLTLDVGVVPALDEAGRCLVIALHALNSGITFVQTSEDLRRARTVASAESWGDAASIAESLGVLDMFEAGRDSDSAEAADRASSPRAYLFAVGAPNSSIALQRLSEVPRRELPGVAFREIFPSRGFMAHAYPESAERRFGLAGTYLHRWRTIAKSLPDAVRVWRRARKHGSRPELR